MAAEKISIVYVRINSGVDGGDKTPYHAQLQYFTASGERKIIEAVAEFHPANEGLTTLLWGSTLATSQTPWGRLIVKPNGSDNVPREQVTDPQKTLAEGADLSAMWTKFQEGAAKVTAEGYWYNPIQQNSNSFAGQLIVYAGLQRSLALDPGTADGLVVVPAFETGLSFPINSNIPGAGFVGRRTENYDDGGILHLASVTDFDGNVRENEFAANGALAEARKLNVDGTSEKSVFDTGTESWSSSTSEFNAYQRLQSQRVVFDDGRQQTKQYDPNNTHPYNELDIDTDATGKVTAAKPKLDGQPANTVDFSVVGQVLGSALGRALAPNNQFGQIAVGTGAGAIGQKLAQAFTASLLTDASKFSLDTAFANFDISLAGAGAGSVASFLTAELGHALGLEGFKAELFNASIGSVASGVANKVAAEMLTNHLSFSAAIGTIDFGSAAINAGYSISGLLGGYLGRELAPAETHQGAVGGQLLGAVGSAVGISAALTGVFGTVLGFIVPGIGSLMGTVLGTLIGDAFAPHPHPAAIDLIDQVGYLYGYTHSQISASDGGDYSIPDPMAAAAVSIINTYLGAVKGAALDHSMQTQIGYVTDPSSATSTAGRRRTNITASSAPTMRCIAPRSTCCSTPR